MFYIYVLQSKKDGKLYTGATEDLRKRFLLHNQGLVFSTKGRGPFILIYYEACLNKQDAFAREKFLKSGPGKKYLKNRLKRFLSLTGQVKEVYPVRGRSPQATVDSNGGYIALITVIIIMALLLGISAVLASSSFFGRFSQLDYENKKVSVGLAEACVSSAFLELVKTPSLNNGALNKCVSVGDSCTAANRKKVCNICSVVNLGADKVIETRAVYGKAYTNLRVRVTPLLPDDFTVVKWEEFTPYVGACTVP